jgi:outer membrane receptor protein involved in Fe transport
MEPPTGFGLVNGLTSAKTTDQTAWTVEVGTRGQLPFFTHLNWELSFYHAWLRDEIVFGETPPGSGLFDVGNIDNTIKAKAYAIMSLRLGYDSPDGSFKVFMDFRNLTDEAYTAATELIADAQGIDTAAFHPRLTRSVYAGIEVKLF